ncbi:MAG: hypothetical protein JSR87_13700 [Proteobacteria bacterium]|nr:hypothetical protein [Pseudomonadota bacterium]MBS0574171.1 hypothetical protein [Pseudomonadota bacterium]
MRGGAPLARMAEIAAMKRDADLAQLAGAAAQLSRAEAMRSGIEADLRRAAAAAAAEADLAGLAALDGHDRFMRQVLDRLAEEIGRLDARKEEARRLAAASFGRAAVLKALAGRRVPAARGD